MTDIELRMVDPPRNRFRLYGLTETRTLFGEPCLVIGGAASGTDCAVERKSSPIKACSSSAETRCSRCGAGRVLVLFRRDIDPVAAVLLKTFNRVEEAHMAPEDYSSFAYESVHFVFIIPPNAHPPGWDRLLNPPTTFEMQVRTLFMHAWAEPEHDILYKAKVELCDDEKRRIAWAASNAWGGDAIFDQVLDSIAARTPANTTGE